MKYSKKNWLLILLVILAMIMVPCWAKDEGLNREYKIKAAFLYNFMNFIEWPKEKIQDSNSITLCIVGKNALNQAFDMLEKKEIGDKPVIVKRFSSLEGFDKDQLQQVIRKFDDAHLLYLMDSEKDHAKAILKKIRGKAILTVGESPHFLENDGIINFVTKQDKLRFEINNRVAQKEKITIRSKLLRLAIRVIQDKDEH